MQLNQIDYFLAVARTLSFTQAANELYISQPALSKQIALLEEELGVKLFIRSSKKVILTRAGELLMDDLTDIKERLERAKVRVLAVGKKERPVCRLACFDGAFVNDCLPVVYDVLEKIEPKAPITLFRGNFIENKNALDQNAIDILITLHTSDYDKNEYVIKKLKSRKSAIIYSKNSRLAQIENISLEDFYGEDYYLLKKSMNPDLYRRGMNNMKSTGIQYKEVVEQENFMTLISAVMLGKGITILTRNVVEENATLLAYPIDECADMDIIVVWKRNHPLASLFEDSFCDLN